jgi:hemerythrin
MPLLHWKDEYSVGIEAVDFEHKQLINLINQLEQKLGADDFKHGVPAFFGDLLKGISAHFALEEKFMRDHTYAQLGAHKQDHERLLDELRDIMDSVEDADDFDAAQLTGRLDEWFTRHFRTHDAELHRTLGPHPS